MNERSIRQLFEEVSAARLADVAFRYKKDGQWHDVTWGEAHETVHRVSRALISLGVEHGQRVGILSQTRLEWVLADFGIVSCGGVTVGIYPSNLAADCAYIIKHSDTELIFVENDEQLRKVLSSREQTPGLRQIVTFAGDSDPGNDVLSWEEFLRRADGTSAQEAEGRARAVGPEDLASLVYTSGTTGLPKAAMITNGNLLFVSHSARQSLSIQSGYITLLFLPLAHVFARLIVYSCLRAGIATAFAEDLSRVAENLREVRPHFIASVPRVFEKVYDKITSGVRDAGGLKEKLFNWALGVGQRVSRLQQENRPVPSGLALKRALADRLVFRKIQGAFGGRLQWAVSGAAPLNQTIAEFFHACGVLILEGLGMTENTSFSNVNRFDRNKFGTVGQAGPGVEMRTADDGEVLFRGPNVMKGYFKGPEATAETIDAEGWLHSGDIGEIDAEGFLKITDRKKDLIITAGGKNIAPQRIERILRTSTYLSQVVAIGDKRKFVSALVTLEPDNIAKWCREQGITFGSVAELADNPDVRALIDREIAERNRELASFESVKKFTIAPKDFSIEAGELTPTMKIKRKFVEQKYAPLIEGMYRE